jgi:hypothetical protein
MGDPTKGTYNRITVSNPGGKGKLVHGIERVTEVVIAGWLLFNMLGVLLVTVGLARQYARAAMTRRDEPTRDVAFDQALSLTE